MRHLKALLLTLVVLASAGLAKPSQPPTEANTLKQAEAAAIHHPHPDYPAEARRRYMTGRGIVVGLVDPKTGRLTSVKMEHSTGHALLDDAVLRAFRQWTFRPGTIRKFRMPILYTMSNSQR